jgi:hypothetical protein
LCLKRLFYFLKLFHMEQSERFVSNLLKKLVNIYVYFNISTIIIKIYAKFQRL